MNRDFLRILIKTVKKRKIPGSLVVVTRKFKGERQYLVIKSQKRKSFSFVSGSLNWGENFQTAAERELKEEIGLKTENLVELPIFHEFRYSYLPIKIKSFQKIFLLNISASVKLNVPKKETENYQWLNIEKLANTLTYPELMKTFKRVQVLLKEIDP